MLIIHESYMISGIIGIIIFNTVGVDRMAILDDGTYHGELEGRSPHGHGRMNYNNGDSYEGQWKDGFMTNGKYTNSELRESFEGTFIKNCPRKGTLSNDRNFLSNFEITCTESIEITQPACWVMMHDLRSKIEDGAIGALMDRKRAEQNENMTKFKNKYIKGVYNVCNEIPVTVSGQPAVIFLCSQSVMGTSTCSEGNFDGKKEFNVMTPVASLPISVEVWVWSKSHLEANMNDSKKDVYYDMDRKIGELKFEEAIKTGNVLKLNLKNNIYSTYINLEFSLDAAGEEDAKLTSGANSASFSLGSLLATLKTYT